MLSAGRFALGMLELAAATGAAWVGAAAIRARVVPLWRGVVTYLADAVIALSVLVVVGEVLGTFGLFRESIVVLIVVATGLALRLLLAVPATQKRVAGTARTLGWDGLAAIVAGAGAGGQWGERSGGAAAGGGSRVGSPPPHPPLAPRVPPTRASRHIPPLG